MKDREQRTASREQRAKSRENQRESENEHEKSWSLVPLLSSEQQVHERRREQRAESREQRAKRMRIRENQRMSMRNLGL